MRPGKADVAVTLPEGTRCGIHGLPTESGRCAACDGVTVSFPAGGLHVELDESNCVVVRSPRTTGDDVVLTVTDVDKLIAGLHLMHNRQRIRNGEPEQTSPIWHAEGVYKIARGTWLVPSRSHPGMFHTVAWHHEPKDGTWYTCSCPVGHERKRMGVPRYDPFCRHVREMRAAEKAAEGDVRPAPKATGIGVIVD